MTKFVFAVFAILAPFLMPWPYAVALAVAAASFMPPVALIVGILFEVLYGTGAVPYAFIIGIAATALMYGVRSFVKARIIGA